MFSDMSASGPKVAKVKKLVEEFRLAKLA